MQNNDIKTRNDGSIDTGFYMKRSRELRSEQAHGMTKGLTAWVSGKMSGLMKIKGPANPQNTGHLFQEQS